MPYTSPKIVYTGTMYIPEDNIYVSFEVTEATPFNKCFACRSFRNGCSGPNILAMGVQRACVFLQTARIFWKLKYPGKYSYQYCADQTKLSLSTVKRTLTGKIEEPEVYTLMQLNNLLVADPNGKFPCACPDVAYNQDNTETLMTATREAERFAVNNDNLQGALDTIHASYRKELDTQRLDRKKEVAALRKEHQAALAAREAEFNERKAEFEEREAEFKATKAHLLQQIEDNRELVAFLRTEMNRRSALIDTYMKVLPPNGENNK